MTVLGFDFGTTNSLASVIVDGKPIPFFENDAPIPSVVSYEGGKVVVGRKARDRLERAGLGIHGSTVRSAKSLLGREEVFIDGVQRDPVDIVTHVIEYVRNHVKGHRAAKKLDIEQVVATIPVNMEGERRKLLRQAFDNAGLGVVQFVHEPLAALYGHIRTAKNSKDLLKRYDGKLLLVFDWGGGTLDLTLCKLKDGLLTQIANDGTEEVGGDIFDDTLRNEVERRYRDANGIGDDVGLLPDAAKNLLHQCEIAKIELSERDDWTVDVESFFDDPDSDSHLSLTYTRDELDVLFNRLVSNGISRISRLLDAAGYSPASVQLCLATGGMVNMPLVKSRLFELFGSSRVNISKNGASAISEGAAWVAHDEAKLHLAKNVELSLARNSYMPLVKAGTQMPGQNQVQNVEFDLYCADPTDGHAKFSLVSPHRPGSVVPNNDERRTLSNMLLEVDAKAKPFTERLNLSIQVDHNLILRATGWSCNHHARCHAEVHDLEFSLAMPGAIPGQQVEQWDAERTEREGRTQGQLFMRSNIASRIDHSLVPGDVLYKYNPQYFDMRMDPPQIQIEERLYYVPCLMCGRRSNDPQCTCASDGKLDGAVQA